jgi:hypothetical protein
MKALSLRSAYICDILSGDKTIEYRTWKTQHRGDLLLVSSQNPRADYQDDDGEWYEYNFKGILPLGYALCVINLTDCKKVDDQYHWLFDNVRPIVPFPVKGQLHLFDVGQEIEFLESYDDAVNIWIEKGIASEDFFNDEETE